MSALAGAAMPMPARVARRVVFTCSDSEGYRSALVASEIRR